MEKYGLKKPTIYSLKAEAKEVKEMMKGTNSNKKLYSWRGLKVFLFVA